MPGKWDQVDSSKLKFWDDDILAHRALGWIQSFDVLWGENLVFESQG